MEEYIVLVNDTNYCYDFHCTFENMKDSCIAEITSELRPRIIINESNPNACYREAAKYMLDFGQIISIMPVSEKHNTQIFRAYVRIEEINRHLLRIRQSFKLFIL